MSILFTQYLMPDGRTKKVSFQPDDPEIEVKALQLITEGLHFDIEMLSTGVISMTCEDKENEVISIELSGNGPEIINAVTNLVNNAYLIKHKEVHV